MNYRELVRSQTHLIDALEDGTLGCLGTGQHLVYPYLLSIEIDEIGKGAAGIDAKQFHISPGA